MRHPRLWSPESPEFYVLTVRTEREPCSIAGELVLVFAHFEAKEGKLYFNGKPFLMRGPLWIKISILRRSIRRPRWSSSAT